MNGLVSIHGDVKRMLEDAILYTLCRELERTNGLPRDTAETLVLFASHNFCGTIHA